MRLLIISCLLFAMSMAQTESAFFTLEGDCDAQGDCVSSSNYPEIHGNDELCTITMLQDASLSLGETFELETCCDHLIIRNVDVENRDQVPSTLDAGERFTFTSDFSVRSRGWQICFSETESQDSVTQVPTVDCDVCVSEFASEGGCECLADDSCDLTPLIPTGCDDSCGDQAVEFCGIGTGEPTQTDPCEGKICTAQSECHDVGVCSNGECSNPMKADGASCNDGLDNTFNDQCSAGVCTGEVDLYFDVTCDPPNQCQSEVACVDGECEAIPKLDDTPCDDGDSRTETDLCVSGQCVGTPVNDKCAGVVCFQQSNCHDVGECGVDGKCTNPLKPNHSPCNDGDPTTPTDVCFHGSCIGFRSCRGMVCTARSSCHDVGTCTNALCSNPKKPDGTPCSEDGIPEGLCTDGKCTPEDILCHNKQPPCEAPLCHTARCSFGNCFQDRLPEGTSCDDGNENTENDTCDSTGRCVGVPVGKTIREAIRDSFKSVIDEADGTGHLLRFSMPALVRKAFHDAAHFDEGKPELRMGCVIHFMGGDGDQICPQHAHFEKAETIRLRVQALLEQEQRTIPSVADMVQLLGALAVDEMTPAEKNKPSLFDQVPMGRIDTSEEECKALDDVTAAEHMCNLLPHWHTDKSAFEDIEGKAVRDTWAQEVQGKMIVKNGLTKREAVALIGAHTVGHKPNFGPWTEDPMVWNNRYYTNLLEMAQVTGFGPNFRMTKSSDGDSRYSMKVFADWFQDTNKPFVQRNSAESRFFRQGKCCGDEIMMLNSDVALITDAEDLVVEFANDEAAWFDAFTTAYVRMGQLGQEGQLRLNGVVVEATVGHPMDEDEEDEMAEFFQNLEIANEESRAKIREWHANVEQSTLGEVNRTYVDYTMHAFALIGIISLFYGAAKNCFAKRSEYVTISEPEI